MAFWMLQIKRATCLCLSRGRWGSVGPPRCPALSPTPAPRLLPSSPGVTWGRKTFSTRRLIMASWGQRLTWASSLLGKITTSSYGVASDTRVDNSKKKVHSSKWCVSIWSQLIWENRERKCVFFFFYTCFYRCSWDKKRVSLHLRSQTYNLPVYSGVQSSQQVAVCGLQHDREQYYQDKRHSYRGDPPSGAEISQVYPVSGQQRTGHSQPHTLRYPPSQ